MNNQRIENILLKNIRRDVLICLTVILTTIAAYWQVRSCDFINYDDNIYITKNPHVLAELSPESVSWAFTSTEMLTWQPMVWLSFMTNYQFNGLDPGWFHLTNLFLHSLNALLLFVIFRRMTGKPWQSGFVMALFALHPIHVETVAWVAARKDQLSTVFLLLTILLYIQYTRGRKSRTTCYQLHASFLDSYLNPCW